MYQEALKKYLAFRKQNREPFKLNIVDNTTPNAPVMRPPGEPNNQEEYDQEEQYGAVEQSEQTNVTNIVNAIPKSYRQKASQILNIIRQNPKLYRGIKRI